jgi:hypothetical protein
MSGNVKLAVKNATVLSVVCWHGTVQRAKPFVDGLFLTLFTNFFKKKSKCYP